jgi:phytol kinase
MILKLALVLGPVAAVLFASEYLWTKNVLKGEKARKFIHVLAGLWIGFWPLILPFDGIFIISIVMFVMVLYSRMTRLFHAIYSVKRTSYGDIFYALGIMISAYLGREPWIFLIAIFLVALADGGAAIIGRYFGSENRYRVFKITSLQKSVAGTAAFIVLAQSSVLLAWFLGGQEVIRANTLLVFLAMPVVAAALENVTPYGTDNVVLPVFATLLLNSLL